MIARHQQGMTGSAPGILCIGSVLWDIIGTTHVRMHAGADVPGRIRRRPGGVALNIALALAGHGLRPAVLTAIGLDASGDELIASATQSGIDCTHAFRSSRPTDCYMAIEAPSGVVAAIADAHSLEAAGEDILAPLADGRLGRAEAPWTGPIVIDGNLTEALLGGIAQSPLFRQADVRVVTASPGKADRLRPMLGVPNATLYVNLEEAGILCGGHFATAEEGAAALMARGVRRVFVTNGPEPVAEGWEGRGIIVASPPPVVPARLTGAGDRFMATHLAAELAGASRADALARGLRAAARFVEGEPD